MIYSPGDWTKKELIALCNFAPEDEFSEDPDVLYSGEIIDADGGGIKYRPEEGANKTAGSTTSPSSISEIPLVPYSIEGNLFEIRPLKDNKD